LTIFNKENIKIQVQRKCKKLILVAKLNLKNQKSIQRFFIIHAHKRLLNYFKLFQKKIQNIN